MKKTLSFVVMDNWKVHLSKAGHPTMLRDLFRPDVWCAGRVRQEKGYVKAIPVSGSLPNVKEDEQDTVESILAPALLEQGLSDPLVWSTS